MVNTRHICYPDKKNTNNNVFKAPNSWADSTGSSISINVSFPSTQRTKFKLLTDLTKFSKEKGSFRYTRIPLSVSIIEPAIDSLHTEAALNEDFRNRTCK
jgi:hypothetical protein